jgi:hypothetical protein
MPPVSFDERIVPTMNTFITYYIFFATFNILFHIVRFSFVHYFLPEQRDTEIKSLNDRIQLQESIMEELIRHLNTIRSPKVEKTTETSESDSGRKEEKKDI